MEPFSEPRSILNHNLSIFPFWFLSDPVLHFSAASSCMPSLGSSSKPMAEMRRFLLVSGKTLWCGLS